MYFFSFFFSLYPLIFHFYPGGKKPKEPADLLNKQKCLEALAVLRHAKWFQVSQHYFLSTLVYHIHVGANVYPLDIVSIMFVYSSIGSTFLSSTCNFAFLVTI